ncbi:Na+/H+ antiporter subunit E [Nesterenkonia lutea]|uniref:Multicomponent Na+:H+ antiporter subunit E n=1 Tax=Nesterenkonia lutea TaxID=272919 RepID=A0ABR9JH55_9MICC|nr:Na+/H+ antiporter subunit E [Nesterenkonia lutea]MBE1525161.1 multicomponent Na+:H+ antiporter subunit E [Nesterenkonia lutea]
MSVSGRPPATAWVLTSLLRGVLLGLLWWGVSGGSADYLVYGAVSVVLATAMSLALLPPQGPPLPGRWPRQVLGGVVLVGWFLGQSALGGLDVARRALARPVNIDPCVVQAPFALPEGPARQLAVVMMNLMPGSMVQRVVTDSGEPADFTAQGPGEAPAGVQLHTLSPDLNPVEQWARLQHRVGAAFAVRASS